MVHQACMNNEIYHLTMVGALVGALVGAGVGACKTIAVSAHIHNDASLVAAIHLMSQAHDAH